MLIRNILNSTNVFFPSQYGGGIMSEVSCESPQPQTCNKDQPSFKAYLSKWMAATAQLVPEVQDLIMPKLQASAKAAAQQCSGGPNGRLCGRRWYEKSWDGFSGVGEQMSALAVVGAMLSKDVAPPITGSTGGTSKSNPGAGVMTPSDQQKQVVQTKDKVGVGIVTALILAGLIGSVGWMMFD
jgi:mannan endo-1,6-alpha-mannosidase